MTDDPLEIKSRADALLEGTAERLGELLRQAAAQLDPFPPYPGAFFTFAIEVDAPGAEDPSRGCVVVGPDGGLYELEIGQELPVFDFEMADPVALRKEELKPLSLHPRDYVVYAYHALLRVVEILLERRASSGS